MASEKLQALSGVLSGLDTKDQEEIAQLTSKMRALKKKVGTQRALQLVGSAMAIGAGKPGLISKLTPKFGLTAAEIAAKKKGLRTERFGLMGEQEKARELILNLKADIGKSRMTQQNSLYSAVASIYNAAKRNASAESIARGRTQADSAIEKEKLAAGIKVMSSSTDPAYSGGVQKALETARIDIPTPTKGEARASSGYGITPDNWTKLNKIAATLVVPGQKQHFYEAYLNALPGVDPANEAETYFDSMKQGKTRPQMGERGGEDLAMNMLKKDLEATSTRTHEKHGYLAAAARERMEAVRRMGTSKHDQALMDNIQSTMTALDGARTPGEADAVLTSLIADFEKPSQIDDARQNEINNLKQMEDDYDKNLGTKPVKEMYRRMEKSEAVKTTQARLAKAGYELTERDVVKLILRNARQQLRSKKKKSAEGFGQLTALLRQGGDVLTEDLPPKDETELTAEAEVAAGVDPEEPKMASLRTKVVESVGTKVPKWEADTSPSDEEVASANLVGGSNPLGQLETKKMTKEFEDKADAQALRDTTEKGANDPNLFK